MPPMRQRAPAVKMAAAAYHSGPSTNPSTVIADPAACGGGRRRSSWPLPAGIHDCDCGPPRGASLDVDQLARRRRLARGAGAAALLQLGAALGLALPQQVVAQFLAV